MLAAFVWFLLAPRSVAATGALQLVGDDAGVTSASLALTGVKQLAPGWRHTCALLESGAVVCWGDNTYGALGDGTNISHNTGPFVASPVA
ncbi:MAG: hypothetical protein IPK16_28580 [Anaerolineales bacterium]|nr:hypothetical protein [Anaerolineales bacterium]